MGYYSNSIVLPVFAVYSTQQRHCKRLDWRWDPDMLHAHSMNYNFFSSSQAVCFEAARLASATVKWIRYRALYITWISLLIEWRHQSKIWCPFLCTAGVVYGCVQQLCTGYTEGYTAVLSSFPEGCRNAESFDFKGLDTCCPVLNGL